MGIGPLRAVLVTGCMLAGLAGAQPQIGGCPVFPADHIWNTAIDRAPVDARSDTWVGAAGAGLPLHADFGADNAIPINIVPAGQPRIKVTFAGGGDESDPGPYPIPERPRIERDTDAHLLIVEQGSCRLYELFAASLSPRGVWNAGSGAAFDLRTYRLRAAGWTSADAAGLPILPGLVRYEEAEAGEIRHALRFTASRTRRAFVWPARHFASASEDASLPPMGARFRLRASFPISTFPPRVQTILRALQVYGMLLADNGSPWFVTGAPDSRWSAMELRQLGRVRGSDFEAVDTTSLQVSPDSGQARLPRRIP